LRFVTPGQIIGTGTPGMIVGPDELELLEEDEELDDDEELEELEDELDELEDIFFWIVKKFRLPARCPSSNLPWL
jgi:hypothetical protein